MIFYCLFHFIINKSLKTKISILFLSFIFNVMAIETDLSFFLLTILTKNSYFKMGAIASRRKNEQNTHDNFWLPCHFCCNHNWLTFNFRDEKRNQQKTELHHQRLFGRNHDCGIGLEFDFAINFIFRKPWKT